MYSRRACIRSVQLDTSRKYAVRCLCPLHATFFQQEICSRSWTVLRATVRHVGLGSRAMDQSRQTFIRPKVFFAKLHGVMVSVTQRGRALRRAQQVFHPLFGETRDGSTARWVALRDARGAKGHAQQANEPARWLTLQVLTGLNSCPGHTQQGFPRSLPLENRTLLWETSLHRTREECTQGRLCARPEPSSRRHQVAPPCSSPQSSYNGDPPDRPLLNSSLYSRAGHSPGFLWATLARADT